MGLAPHRIRTLLVDGLLVVAVLASVVTLAAAPPGAIDTGSTIRPVADAVGRLEETVGKAAETLAVVR
ncbi:hypothetical protein, partial [Clavibacter michiganensis]|uniref:hypothetical protein n=1 Tax=Clavibacter michiganensis TaxID=28447 RepID=UPI00292E6918